MSRRTGFTLVELLLASTIAVMLMGAVMVSIGTITNDRKRLAGSGSPSRASSHEVVDFLRRDLMVAQRMWKPTEKHGLLLTGYGGISPRTLEPNGRLVRVEYLIEDDTLIRRQWYLDGKPEFWAEVISRDVKRLEVERILERIRDTGKRRQRATTLPVAPGNENSEPERKLKRKTDPLPDGDGEADMDGDGYIDEEWEKAELEAQEQQARALPTFGQEKQKKKREKDLPLRITPRVRLTVEFADESRQSYSKELLIR